MKFKGKSDIEMKKIRMNNVLSKQHTKKKETSIDKIHTYLYQNEDLRHAKSFHPAPTQVGFFDYGTSWSFKTQNMERIPALYFSESPYVHCMPEPFCHSVAIKMITIH
jgi:hypothetical protein